MCCLLLVLGLLSACALGGDGRSAAPLARSQERAREIERATAVLDTLHRAAAQADGPVYFDLFAPDAIYYGTDPTERWTKQEFQAFAEPYFSRGRGWSYTSTERHVYLSSGGDVAWFDERLWNESYGETRGTGVLIRRGPPGTPWHIVQYNLSFPVPNSLAADLVERIRQ